MMRFFPSCEQKMLACVGLGLGIALALGLGRLCFLCEMLCRLQFWTVRVCVCVCVWGWVGDVLL